jgi:mannose-1-phosphate guanylyltransferase/mannose-6-phosphate isomerase
MAGDLAFQADPDALVLLLPSDHHVADPDAFRRAVALAAPAAAAGKLVTFGVIPTRPETGYGYILAGEERSPGLWTVARFVEKPDSETAAAYVADGRYFWNAGIFLARAEKLLAEMARFRPDILEASRAALARADIADGAVRLDRAAFEACPSESLDYAVMERTADAVVAPIDIGWSDVGGFDTLWETSRRDEHGNSAEGAILIDVTDTLVRTDGPLVAALGVSDLVIVVQDGAVLVAPRERAQDIKRLIAELRTRGRTDAL